MLPKTAEKPNSSESPVKPGSLLSYEYRIRRRRTKSADAFRAHNLTRPEEVAVLFRRTLYDAMTCREHFLSFYLDLRCVVGYELIAIGNSTGVTVSPSEVFRGALLAGAVGLVLAHNHPSGEVEPSKEDDEISLRLQGCGDLLGIPVLDHVIVSESEHFSYKERNRAPWTHETSLR